MSLHNLGAVLHDRGRYDAAGRVIPHADLSARARRLLRDYRLVQYDLVGGRGFAEAALLGPTESR